MDAHYRKINDRSLSSRTYHKRDKTRTAVRAKLKAELQQEVKQTEKNSDLSGDMPRESGCYWVRLKGRKDFDLGYLWADETPPFVKFINGNTYLEGDSVLKDSEWVEISPPTTQEESRKERCPIYDRDHKPMGVGDSFIYQVNSPYECVVTIKMGDGGEWACFSDGTKDRPLADFWHPPIDEQISVKIEKPVK